MTEKKFILREIETKYSDKPFQWKDLKHFQFEDEDLVSVEYVEPYYSENNSWDGHFKFVVRREILETDEQFERRLSESKRQSEEMKKRRYENYLKLKAEFENESEKET